MKQMDLSLLVPLDALLSTCSVTEAAKRLHLSTPAMSHVLARIRLMANDPILVRAGRKLVPTPHALALQEPVRQLLAQAQALLVRGDEASLASLSRVFTVRAPEGISLVFGAPLSLALEKVMPHASVRFLSESPVDDSALREGRIDVDLGARASKEPELQSVLLARQNLVGAVQPGHPLLRGRMTARRFAAARHVEIPQSSRDASPVDEALQALGLQRFVAMTVHSSHGALVVAARSQLVACVPEVMAQAMQTALKLEVFKLPLEVRPVPRYMAWHPRHSADAAHQVFRACLQTVMDERNWQQPVRR
jgi:DNA-binding transcriptional LysR family regulator